MDKPFGGISLNRSFCLKYYRYGDAAGIPPVQERRQMAKSRAFCRSAYCAAAYKTPSDKLLLLRSKGLQKSGDVPKSPFFVSAALLPSAGTA
jgi:hypothetical protein